MGAGKSTIGSELARQLNYLHIDTDAAIESFTGMSISSIFNIQGESVFRSLELMMLSLISDLDKVVISTGGGLPIIPGALDIILNTGITIYLECEIEELARRISQNEERPLHNQDNKASLADQITTRLGERKQFYEQAHLVINSLDLDDAKKEITSRLGRIT